MTPRGSTEVLQQGHEIFDETILNLFNFVSPCVVLEASN